MTLPEHGPTSTAGVLLTSALPSPRQLGLRPHPIRWFRLLSGRLDWCGTPIAMLLCYGGSAVFSGGGRGVVDIAEHRPSATSGR